MTKTKTVTKKAWGVFDEQGKLSKGWTCGGACIPFLVVTTKTGARIWACPPETVRPVEIRWEVEE